jgi:hypothetical protein
MSDVLSLDPNAVTDPIERARLVFTQWHVDEVTGDAEAADYANRLIAQLAEFGLTITQASPGTPAPVVPEKAANDS